MGFLAQVLGLLGQALAVLRKRVGSPLVHIDIRHITNNYAPPPKPRRRRRKR